MEARFAANARNARDVSQRRSRPWRERVGAVTTTFVLPEKGPLTMPDDFAQIPTAWIKDADHARGLLAAYLTPGLFTGSLWDPAIERRLEPAARDLIDVEDLYSPTLLSAPIRRSAGQAIIERKDEISEHLRGIDPEITLWHTNSVKVNAALDCANELVARLEAIDHIGWTKASKLVAAKRPKLIPIWDKQVSRALGADKMSWHQYWAAWRRSLTPVVVDDLRELAVGVGHPNLSPLRTIDIIIWMDEWGWKDLPTPHWDELREACPSRHTQ